jgi:ABC-type lipoprotein export system ATPase subunit
VKTFVLQNSVSEIINLYPYARDFFDSIGIVEDPIAEPLPAHLKKYAAEDFERFGMDAQQIVEQFIAFLEKMEQLRQKARFTLAEITIRGGRNKSGLPEVAELTIRPGEVISIVGPTGSGKSRLLADIECLAQGDTPTGRRVLLNGAVPSSKQRFSVEDKLIAQLSQNMNYIMDLSVEEFITMHAESRMLLDVPSIVEAVIECANDLAGEKFASNTPVTALSGGQSRALMIADVALLSKSPIVLIDEIENAGVDRKKALDLLVQKEKLVLMSTHDPILALLGHKRIVIKNGGIHNVLQTSQAELANLKTLERIDRKMMSLRNTLRMGQTIDFDINAFMEMT